LALSKTTSTATTRYWSLVVSGAKSSFVQLDQKLIASVFIEAFIEERVKVFLKVSPLFELKSIEVSKTFM
jgi:hypothetical protein